MREAGIDHLAEEFEKIGREEREQYEVHRARHRQATSCQSWPAGSSTRYFRVRRAGQRKPRSAREALGMAIAIERRTQNFYTDVAESSRNDAVAPSPPRWQPTSSATSALELCLEQRSSGDGRAALRLVTVWGQFQRSTGSPRARMALGFVLQEALERRLVAIAPLAT